jgi:hypothetical protein
MKRLCPLFYWPLAWIVCLCIFGCGDPNEKKTIQGLQEENKSLREQIKLNGDNKTANKEEVQAQIKSLKDENEALVKRLKNENSDSLIKERELHQTRMAQFESEIASLRLELTSIKRERLALQEMVDREPNIKNALLEHNNMGNWVFALLLGTALLILGFFVFRWRITSDRLNLLTMQQVGELRRIGGEE